MKTNRKVWGLVAVFMLVSSISLAKGKKETINYYTVLPGDTLDSIALELGVTVGDLVEWNGDGVGELYVGTNIRAKSSERGHLRASTQYKLKEGETLAQVAGQFSLSEVQLRVLNPEFGEENEPNVGDMVHVLAKVRSRRHGVDANGKTFFSKITEPEWLGREGVGYRVKWERNVWGTKETVQLLRLAFKRVALTYPNTAPFVVGDISRKSGGAFPPHVSHKTGLDIDLSFAFLDDLHRERFEVATRETMDAEKTWTFVRAILETGHTQYIFIDHKLQKPLYEQALLSGMTPGQLEEIFQYPRRRGVKRGIIRHTRGHKNHMHVRFGFKKKYLSTETLEALRNVGNNPIVQIPEWVRGIFA